jgi:hypothetical protein
MPTGRRGFVAVSAGVLTAGCAAPSDGDSDGDTPPEQPGPDTPECDPADVTRPAVAAGTNLEGREYPRKPADLTDQSILEYLDDFETAFAWNRVLESAPDATSINVDNLDGFSSDETGDGFLASSGIRVTYSAGDGSSTERTYVANYFVTPGPVYRYETDDDPATPEPEDEETLLVQCGTDA